MGGKKSKQAAPGKPAPGIPPKSADGLTESDYQFLQGQTGLGKNEIKAILDQFNANNPDGKLDKKEFIRLYDQLRPEPPELLDEISEFVFRTFDSDRNGYINFNEFLVAYALTSRGDQRKKLEYAFSLYDSDGNNSIDSGEVRAILSGMLDMLGADKKANDPQALAAECLQQLDANRDGKLSKDEFINGLLANYSLRSLMSPFN